MTARFERAPWRGRQREALAAVDHFQVHIAVPKTDPHHERPWSVAGDVGEQFTNDEFGRTEVRIVGADPLQVLYYFTARGRDSQSARIEVKLEGS